MCFDDNKEKDGGDCWEECTLPSYDAFKDPAHESFGSCESFCSAVEECMGKKCSSGPACESQFYETLNCGVKECTCTGSGNMEEQNTLADSGGIESDECLAETAVRAI